MAPIVLGHVKNTHLFHPATSPVNRPDYYPVRFAGEEKQAQSTYVLAEVQAANELLGLHLNHGSKGNPCLPVLPVRATGCRPVREEIRKLRVLPEQDQQNQLPMWITP